MKNHCSATVRHFCLTLIMLFAITASHAMADEYNKYKYRLETGQSTKVCRHMNRVYNRDFRQPWGNPTEIPVRTPTFPRLPGVEYDERMARELRYSAFPTNAEFDAIQWREGRYMRDEEGKRLSPLLIADLDIDNDSHQDAVVKRSFMHGFWPGGHGAPGGEDQLFVFDRDQLDLSRSMTPDHFYGRKGERRPARIAYDTLGLSARSIRPFVYDGATYLSVYEQCAVDDPKERRETMWVLKYRGGGEQLARGWEPVRADRVCRFRMIVVK